MPGQREVFAQVPRAAAEEEAAAHIGEQADVGFGHGEPGALGGQAHLRALRNAHAATHHDAVHEGHHRLRVAVHQVVQPVFLGEEIFQLRVA